LATNVYFSQKHKPEQHLYEDIVIESLKMYGQDVLYIPRKLIAMDDILNEDYSKFVDAYAIEMYIETVDGFAGEGDLLSKFGVEIRDQATFVVSRRRWEQLVGIWNNSINNVRPSEGDLIYLPLSNSLFEIRFVEHEKPFYQLSNLPTYTLQCELFEYNQEEMETGIREIDRIEERFSTQLVMSVTSGSGNFIPGERVTQDTGTTTTDIPPVPIYIEGEVAAFERASSSAVPSTLTLVGVRGTDGTDRTFYIDASERITGDDSGVAWVITDIHEERDLDNDTYADNNDFEIEGDAVIDFSETNPFGEP
jgi:hypothetical protein